jgi:hypothetical protein
MVVLPRGCCIVGVKHKAHTPLSDDLMLRRMLCNDPMFDFLLNMSSIPASFPSASVVWNLGVCFELTRFGI